MIISCLAGNSASKQEDLAASADVVKKEQVTQMPGPQTPKSKLPFKSPPTAKRKQTTQSPTSQGSKKKRREAGQKGTITAFFAKNSA